MVLRPIPGFPAAGMQMYVLVPAPALSNTCLHVLNRGSRGSGVGGEPLPLPAASKRTGPMTPWVDGFRLSSIVLSSVHVGGLGHEMTSARPTFRPPLNVRKPLFSVYGSPLWKM